MKKILIVCLILPFLSMGREKTIVNETFDYPDGVLPDNWWSEGCQGIINNGHLYVDADTAFSRMSTLWLDKKFGGNFSVEFDVHIISSEKKANNINCFLLYSCPDGKSLRETKNERQNGSYESYHKLNGYIFTYLANGSEDTARFRFRYNPGFQLLEENHGYRCKIGETYHIKIIKYNDDFQFWVDGNKMVEKAMGADSQVYKKGLFGFRTWRTTLWWDNLVIKQY